MKRSIALRGVAAVVGFGVVLGAAQGQTAPRPRIDIGKLEYDSNCASCHGLTGKGDGPLKPFLSASAPDLTQIAKKNGGVFPIARMYEVIEGSQRATAHGTSEMPVWGWDYRLKAAEYYMDTPYDPDAYIRMKVLALMDYVNRLQVK